MKVSIQKYDPSVDNEPYIVEYEIEKTENMSVLEAIIAVHEKYEPLAFDYSCRGRMCGRCAVTVDGEPCMACTTAIKGDCLIAPLKGFDVVRDLVVDKESFHDRISKLDLRIRPTEITVEEFEKPIDYEEVYLPMLSTEYCCRCGCCYSACPTVQMEGARSRYVGPAGMVALAYRNLDPYDQGDRVAQAVQEGLWNCIMCGTCDKVCAAGIDHQSLWTSLREQAEARGLTEKPRNFYLF